MLKQLTKEDWTSFSNKKTASKGFSEFPKKFEF